MTQIVESKRGVSIDIDDVVTDLNGKMDVDGTNASASVKAFDGQWVNSRTTIASEVALPTSAVTTYSLANYLPNDNYSYEVLFTAQITSGDTSGNTASLALQTDILPDNTYVVRVRTRTSSTVGGFGCCILPIGSGRSVIVDYYQANTGTYQLYANGYRRIGTNS